MPCSPSATNRPIAALAVLLIAMVIAGLPGSTNPACGFQDTDEEFAEDHYADEPDEYSAFEYAFSRPTDEDLEKRDRHWERVIENSLTTGRTAQHAPGIDPTAFEPSEQVSADEADFWSFRRLSKVQPPQIHNDQYVVHNSIDQFIVAQLIENNLPQNPRANNTDLLRRVTYDITGLPPQHWNRRPKTIAGQAGYRQVVDQLLSDSNFGQRWARLWLDLARYADSNGFEEDDIRPAAYAYRDFVTWAMNKDLSYKLFVQWQIAGDQLEPENPLAVAATGFLTAGPINTFMPQETERLDELDDVISTMGRSLLGMTIGCARCHDHIYDPIPAEDYYGLVAVFQNTKRDVACLLPDRGQNYRQSTQHIDQLRARVYELLVKSGVESNLRDLQGFTEDEIAILRRPIDPSNLHQSMLIEKCMGCVELDDDDIDYTSSLLPEFEESFRQLAEEIDRLEPTLPPPVPTGLVVRDGKAESFYVLENGRPENKGAKVHPGFLTALTHSQPKWTETQWQSWAPSALVPGEHFPRTALAIWLSDTEHGAGALLARVIVNRLWQQYFGQGIVSTPSDFGSLGAKPTHPELLEWLAGELVANDWSLRHIHRLILTSATYQQSCADHTTGSQTDLENRWLWRQNRKRLTAEMIRDSLLVLGGNLNPRMYGPAITPTIPYSAVVTVDEDPDVVWPMLAFDDAAACRRSLYILGKRNMSMPLLRLFDAPDASNSCETRSTTNVPTQSLALWNSPFVRFQSQLIAKQVDVTNLDHATTIQSAYRRILMRDPTSSEIDDCANFLASLEELQQQALLELCHVLVMSNEFVYLN